MIPKQTQINPWGLSVRDSLKYKRTAILPGQKKTICNARFRILDQYVIAYQHSNSYNSKLFYFL